MKQAWVLRPQIMKDMGIYHDPHSGLEESIILAQSIDLEIVRAEIVKLRKQRSSS